jgi:hypothetical protein
MAVFSAGGLTVTDNAQVGTAALVPSADKTNESILPDQQVNDYDVTFGSTALYVDEARDIALQVERYLVTGGAINYTSKSGVTVVGAAFNVGAQDSAMSNTNPSAGVVPPTSPGVTVQGHVLTLVQAQLFFQSVADFCDTEPAI